MSNFAPIYNVVRNKLKKSDSELPDDDSNLIEETGFVVQLLLAKFPTFGKSYDAITDAAKKSAFDGAAGRVVAARIRPRDLAATNGGAGVIVESEIGDVRKRYAAYTSKSPGQVGQKSIEEQWIDEATDLLATVRRPLAGKGSFIGLPGRRRAEETRTGFKAIDARELLLPRSC